MRTSCSRWRLRRSGGRRTPGWWRRWLLRLLLGRRSPCGRRRAVWRWSRWRRAVARWRTHGCAERIEPLGRASLKTLGLCGTKRAWRCLGWLLRRWRPLLWRCWRGGRRRRVLRWLLPLLRRLMRRRLLRRRRIVRLRRRRTPLRRSCWRRRRGVVGGRALRARCWCRRARRRRGQGRAAGKTELAGGLVSRATPRADDHESDSRELRTPPNRGGPARAQHTRFRSKRREIARSSVSPNGRVFGSGARGRPTAAQRSFSSWTRAALPLSSRR